ncbi:hypothetical protein EWM64_g6622 [Hericium alpestre]|uniref:Uncharacterized protein n=1 Tax=Hericium alpestre TaxID=135208 RepID=A0A4Y9ZR79_9AGAM|nr:hypothetical protein EWM64_g6622 [Hericium alpestre]
MRPKFRTLSEVYKEEGLHYFRSGWGYDTGKQDVADLEWGVEQLRKDKLAHWIEITTSTRGLSNQVESEGNAATSNGNSEPSNTFEDPEMDMGSAGDKEPPISATELQPLAWRYSVMINGDSMTEVGIEELLKKEIEDEGRHWEDKDDFEDWQEAEPEHVPEIQFNDGVAKRQQ